MATLIQDIIADVIRAQGVDTRLVHVHEAADDIVECSDPDVAGALRARLVQSADTAHVRVETLPRPGLPEWMLVVSAVADVRREPRHQSELVSQAIHGDAVAPLRAENEWTLVRMDDGYIGWIRDWHLKTPAERTDSPPRTHRIKANHAVVLETPAGSPLIELVVGTSVVVGEAAGRGLVNVRLADGRTGVVARAALEKVRNRRPTPERLAETGRRFIGIPYLWGGTTPNGFDCSGLIQRVYRLNGIVLPRDSDQQARFGVEKPTEGPESVAPGDLLFFGKSRESITHVGLVLADRTFLHAYGQVVVNSLDSSHPRYSARLASIWQLTRDPLRKRSPGRGSKLAPDR
jgi:cell wall-associated NlpC family hydrolase